MRVIVITNRFGDVGTHPQLTRLALHLRQSGHDVRAVSLAAPGTIAATFKEVGIATDVIRAPRRGALLPVAGKLASTFHRYRPDAVVAFLYEAIMPTRAAALVARVPTPVISSIRNEYFGPRRREIAVRMTERLSAATVVNSQRVADSLVGRGIVSPKQVVVIRNGIDTSRFVFTDDVRLTTRKSLGMRDTDFVWLTMGRLVEQKSYPNLIRAFALLLQEVPQSRLVIAGRGRMQDELESLARETGTRASISFIGFRQDIPSLLAAADAFVMASRYEGMPNALIEAFAAGVASVATNVGGVPELIQEGVTGYLVPPGQPQALAAAMGTLATTPAKRRTEIGERGRALVRELCDINRVMESWEDLIAEVSARSRGSRRG